MRVKTRKGRNIVIEINARVLHDRNNRIIGRAGVVRDISEEFALREQVKEFTVDIGNVLHSYSSILISVHHSIRAVIDSLGIDPFEGEETLLIEREMAVLQQPTANLIFSLDRLNGVVTARGVSNLIQQNQWLELQHSIEKLNHVKDIPYLEFRLPTLREIVQHIIDICRKIEVVKQIQDMVLQVRNAAEELLRICSLINLHYASDAIIAIGQQVRSLREYVIFGARKNEPKIACKIGELIFHAVIKMEEFARSQGVVIKTKVNTPNIYVKVVERDVVRALTNLLHNAIKYSWCRNKGESLWILIRSLTNKDNQISIEFENFGVPIPKEEISQDLIFQIGYRGRLSSDRGRMGTGVGLSDSRRVAREYGGNMIIKSRPAFPARRDDDYNHPFLTTAVFTLPILTR
ncbi:MAG: domain S-box protein [Acidobacteriota bacterium]|nr:domain S-box protein [Acidobacteriota bacterium]